MKIQNNSLFSILKALSEKELRNFDRFLRSPYFTEGKNIRSKLLYEYFCILKEFYPAFDSSELKKETLFKRLYPDRKFNSVLLRRLDSDLGKLAIEFLNQEEFYRDTAARSLNAVTALIRKMPEKFFYRQFYLSERTIDIQKYDSNYYYNKQSLELIRNNYAYTKGEMLKKYDVKSEADYFIKYTLCRALEIYRNIENDKAILNTEINTKFFENILDFAESHKEVIAEDDLIAMHYNEILLNIRKEDKYYYELKEIKNRIEGRLNSHTLRNLYVTMVNYCIRKTNLGFTGFDAERFELDKEIMQKDIHSTGEYFDMNYFLSTVRNAVSLGKHNWSEDFIRKYGIKLEPRHKAFAESYALGALAYGKKEYGKALEHLSKINIEYSARKQQIKNLMIVIYCETGAYENALNLIDTSKHSLKHDKQIPEERKKTFSKFLVFAGKYIKLELDPDDFKANSLKQKIIVSGHFANREWLLKKIADLTIHQQ